MKGFKYIAWDTDDHNAEIYLNKSNSKEVLNESELKLAKGYYDKSDVKGIYYCESQEKLIPWVKDCFEWENPSYIEILEISPVTEATIRYYEDGRIAYVTEAAQVRVLEDNEIDTKLLDVIVNHFG